MGFYGNVADTSRIHFQFDKIFNTRQAMDGLASQGLDGIFSGRFVLIKYDPQGDYAGWNILSGYRNEHASDSFCVDKDCEHPYHYTTFTKVNNPSAADWESYFFYDGNNYYKLPSESYFDANEQNYYMTDSTEDNLIYDGQILQIRNSDGSLIKDFVQCDGAIQGTNLAHFTSAFTGASYVQYLENYNIDKLAYGEFFDPRGYDGTVWQKVYSGGFGKFIMIASLNGSVPELELYPAAPSLFPAAPRIDGHSGGALYRIYVPSKWGFRIKESDPVTVEENGVEVETYPYSDEEIIQTYKTFPVGEPEGTEERAIHAAIYFNKKADNILYSYNDITQQNRILIEPTGESGQEYYSEGGNLSKLDTYELSVYLPMVGNLVSNGYDLIYGVHENPDEDGNYQRYTDINFYPGTSTDELKQNGNSALGGKTHDLTTLAGTINTAHDILGQIVVPLQAWPSDEQVKSLSTDYLYLYDGTYYYRGYAFTKTLVNTFRFDEVTITSAQFTGNKYYEWDGEKWVPAVSYNSNKRYALRSVNTVRYTPVSLSPYTASTYYLKEGENWWRDNQETYPTWPERTYYTITASPAAGKTFNAQYKANGSFYTIANATYTGSTLTAATFIPSYEPTPDVDLSYYQITPGQQISTRYYYHPGSFYYETEEHVFVVDDAQNPTPGRTYYAFTFETTPKYGYNNGQIVQYYEEIESERVQIPSFYTKPNNINNYYTVVDGVYYSYENIKYIPMEKNKDPYTVARSYYILSIGNGISENPPGSLYLPGVYYTKDDIEGHYTKCYQALEELPRGTRFYLIASEIPVPYPFYIPNKYYDKVGVDEYILSQSDTMIKDQYYEKTSVYVDNDETGQCPHGYEWNDYASYVPPSITLYTAEKKASMVRMSELGKDTNSLFGILLDLNKMYARNDEETRDIDTVRGAYNTLRDMLYQVKTLRPGYMLYVNDFGQIESMSLSDLKIALQNA